MGGKHMIMEKYQVQMNKMKGMFFDLITNEDYASNFNALVHSFLEILKEEFSAKKVEVFIYNKWKERYMLEHSTDTLTEAKLKKGISKDGLERFAKENLYNEVNIVPANELWGPNAEPYSYITPIYKKDKYQNVIGWIEIVFEEELVEDHRDLLFLLGIECSKLFDSWKRFYGSIDEEARYEQLYRVTAKFHSSMDMDEVLGEVISTLKEVYPSFEYFLLLSHDNTNHQDLPIKDLQYGSNTTNPAAAQAYLTGSIQFEDSLIDGRSVLYAPLKGKQGVYGVLQVMAPNTLVFPEQEVGFITLLANTAGSALENAQLYQQSKRLIADLQLINKTSHRLNLNLRLSETINFMADQITSSFDAEEVGFIIFDDTESYEVLLGSSTYFVSKEAYDLLQHLNSKIRGEKDSLFIGDLSQEKEVELSNYRSLLAVPMIQSGLLKGAVYVMHHRPYHFTFDNFKLLQSLIHHSTLAFTNSMLREELEKLVITDHLTKLYSRNYLDEIIQESMQDDEQGTFLLMDIDDFKLVNDTYGHQVGDEVIIQVAEIMNTCIGETDVGARWGGEELAVYLPKVHLIDGIKIAERMVKMTEETTNPKITISCGAAYWSKDREDTVKGLFNRADEALYKAKKSGKNKVIIHEEDEHFQV